MRLLKWIFNLLRTLSFFIVIGLSLIIVYFVFYPEDIEPLFQTQQMEIKGKYSEEEIGAENEEIGMMSLGEETGNAGESSFKNLSAGQEYLVNGWRPKIKIKTTTGFVFLRPSQIVSIHSGRPNHTISTIQGKTMQVYNRDYSLKAIYENSLLMPVFFL